MSRNRWKKAAGILCLCALLAGLTGCAKKEPLSLTVWTYYNGEQLGAFNEAVEAFNATVGKDKNIVVSASSLGSVNDLEQNVMDAVQGKVGAQEVPDIFSAYADTAYAVDSLGRVAEELAITKGTAQGYSRSAYRKAGIHSKDELIDLCQLLGEQQS